MSSLRGRDRRQRGALATRARNNNNALMPLMKQIPLSTFRERVGPPEMDIKLQWVNVGVFSAAQPAGTVRYNPNCPYQPLVGGSTGIVPGWDDWIRLYGFYRVVAYDYEIEVTNNEAYAINSYVINSNNDPTNTANSLSSCNALCSHAMIAAKGGLDKHVFKGHCRISEVVGTPAIEYADSYRALINAAPADVTWLAIGGQSAPGSNLTLGFSYTVYITFYIRFYDRLLQS